jgi:hypothetical protein
MTTPAAASRPALSLIEDLPVERGWDVTQSVAFAVPEEL